MKKSIFISLLICFGLVSSVPAQHKDDKRKEYFEQFRAKRIAYITDKVKLTPSEAQVFWPLANELQEKKYELNKPLREERQKLKASRTTLTEADYLKIIDANAEIGIKEAQLNKEYLEKFKKTLSAEKIFKYQKAEEEFMRQMFSPRNSWERERGARPGGRR
ncbi:MAG: hypothetical protein LBC40_07445 [Dysgonamonadaceae bacterium]|jgi:hypothetical protein|nr:hypothetical protein [Dysgonamonadaceae bacterium]